MNPIQFASPYKAYEHRSAEVRTAVTRVLESGYYIGGPTVTDFEKAFAAWLSDDDEAHCVSLANGTDALEVSIRALLYDNLLDNPRQNAIFTVSHTATATVAAIDRAECTPVLADIDADTYTMSPDSLRSALEFVKAERPDLRPAAIIPVHLYGHPCDMDAIMAIANEHNLPVIEDCAQAHGAYRKGKKVGLEGAIGSFSFYPTKNLGAFGDAGAICMKDQKLAEFARTLSQYGWVERYNSTYKGVNSRMDPIQAAILHVQLAYLDDDVARRREIAQAYGAGISHDRVSLPHVEDDVLHAFHLYVVRTDDRDGFMAHMNEHKVGCGIHYPVPVHRQPAYADCLLAPGGLPVTEDICGKIVSLPMHPFLTDDEVAHVCRTINSWQG